MLNFDVSVIDIVLAIAVVVLLLIFISQRQNKLAESESKKNRKFLGTGARTVKFVDEKVSITPSYENGKCAHHFGYLKDHPRSTPIPDECFGCQKVMRCLAAEGSG